MRRYYAVRLLALAFLFIARQAHAGAWTQPQGQGQLILSSYSYFADSFYDTGGHLHPQPHYRKYELDPYLEYGVRDDITLGTNLSLQRASQSGSPGLRAQDNWGLGDSEFFVRKRMWQQDGFVASVEPLIKLPSPASSGTDQPKLGGSHTDFALGLPVGYGFSAWGHNHFVDLDTQYRYRFGSAKDQLRISATVGAGLTQRWTLMPQLFQTLRTSSPARPAFTQSSGDDYNATRVQLSALYALASDVSVQFGGFQDVAGKNTGRGKGVLVALWKRI